jgi:dihydrofolate reductase
MRLSLIVAMDRNRVIGCNGRLPWRISADLKRFKELTLGHSLIMGRRTFESIGRPLPGRRSIVLTSRTDTEEFKLFQEPLSPCANDMADSRATVVYANSLRIALDVASKDRKEIFVIGGGVVFEETIELADRLYVTLVNAEVSGETLFPEYDKKDWNLLEKCAFKRSEKNEFSGKFCVYERVRPLFFKSAFLDDQKWPLLTMSCST